MSTTDDLLAQLLGRNSDLFTTYESWSNAQIMLLAGSIDDPASFNASGGKTGALGYYPVVNVNGETIYVPCQARLQAMAAGGADPAVLENLLGVQVAAAQGKVDAAQAQVALAVQAKVGAETAAAVAEDAASRVQPITADTDWWSGLEDPFGRFVGMHKNDGTLSPEKFRAPDGSITRSALASALLPLLLGAPVGTYFQQLTEEMGGRTAIVDQSGRPYAVFDCDGIDFRSTIKLPPATVSGIAGQASAAAKADLGFSTLPPELDLALVVVDLADRPIFTLPASSALPTLGGTSGLDAPSINDRYAVLPILDLDGKQQIHVTRRGDGRSFKLTSTGDNRGSVLTDDDKVIYSRDGIRYYQPAEGGPEWRTEPTPRRGWAFGDSITEATPATQWQPPIFDNLGISIANEGISSQKTGQIAARLMPLAKATVTGNQIPASGPVAVFGASGGGQQPDIDLLTAAAWPELREQQVSIAGVLGTLTKDASNNYSFTRSSSGSAVACPAATLIVPQRGVEALQDLLIYASGRNDGYQYTTVTQPLIQQVVAARKNLYPGTLICGITPRSQPDEYSGQSARTIIDNHNAWGASTLGGIQFGTGGTVVNATGMWVDWGYYLRNYGLGLLGLPPTAQDLSDISNGVTPHQLMRSDEIHPNDLGNQVIAMMFTKILIAKGWTW